MAIPLYLAMTAAEFLSNSAITDRIGWMACHFSPYGTGLSNLPEALPKDSLLILNDRTPIRGHDSERILQQLNDQICRSAPAGLLLDFQRPGIPETQELVKFLSEQLSCPIAVSMDYAVENHAVFLPPVPLNCPLSEYIAPWRDRKIWLDAALDGASFHIDANGCRTAPLLYETEAAFEHRDDALHCHYKIKEAPDSITFELHRTRDDLRELLKEAENSGVTTAVGLFQELFVSGQQVL